MFFQVLYIVDKDSEAGEQGVVGLFGRTAEKRNEFPARKEQRLSGKTVFQEGAGRLEEMALARAGGAVEEYGARMRMEASPEKVQGLSVLPSGDEVFKGMVGGGRRLGKAGGMTAFYRSGQSWPVVAYFQWTKGLPDSFFKEGSPGGREPAEEKFVGEMDGEDARIREREGKRGEPGCVRSSRKPGGLFGKSGREHFLQTLGIRGEGVLSSGGCSEGVSSLLHCFLARSHSKNRAGENERKTAGILLKSSCYHR